MPEPKTQHYVPRFILRQFLVDPVKEQVSVYDKQTDRGFVTSIDNVMAENHFHDFDFEKWTVSFEPVASKIEEKLLPTYRRILDTRRLTGTPEEKADLAFFIAFQFLRTKSTRRTFQDMEALLQAKLEAEGQHIEDLEGWEPLTDDVLKRNALMIIQDSLPKFAKIISIKDFGLAEPPPGRDFYLGDNPVCLHNANDYRPYGNLGLAVKGIEIYLPLASDLMLFAWCPSIMAQIRGAYETKKNLEQNVLQLHMTGRLSAAKLKTKLEENKRIWKPASELIRCIESGVPTQSGLENMDFYNSLQTAAAHRFIVCQQSDFELAKRFNKEFPHLRQGRKVTFA